jgi:hypothetical protein
VGAGGSRGGSGTVRLGVRVFTGVSVGGGGGGGCLMGAGVGILVCGFECCCVEGGVDGRILMGAMVSCYTALTRPIFQIHSFAGGRSGTGTQRGDQEPA